MRIDSSRASTVFSPSPICGNVPVEEPSLTPPTMSAMQTVFISSIQSGFDDVRAAARAGMESFGWRPVMAELAGASPASPQRALLDRVGDSDVLLLLVGPRYGAKQESGLSATEEEFDEARRRGKSILVLRQEGELEPEQQEFLKRATAGWEGGALYGTFRDASDVGLAVVRGLTNIRDRGARATLEPAAQTRAAELAADAKRQGYNQGGSIVRVVLVPLVDRPLLDAATLEDPELPDELAAAARAARIVSQSEGITPHVSAAGVRLEVGERYTGRLFSVGKNVEIIAEASVAGDDQTFGSMRILPERLEQAVRGTIDFAEGVWRRIDPRGEVQEIAVTLAIPEAQHKSWGRGRGGNTLSMGGMFSLPEVAIAPQPARIFRRADLSRDETAVVLVAELRRLFVDAGAVDEG
jgi:Domain of unknown function (DUF4062)